MSVPEHDETAPAGDATTVPAHDATHSATGAPPPPLDRALSFGELRAGERVGRYVIAEPIGRGGMGEVYRARDPELDRELAIKLVLPTVAGSRAQQRLLDEARAMARLRHPAVVPVFDVGVAERGVYVVMPYVAGSTLADWFAAGPHPWRETVGRFVIAARGLIAAHAAGLVHRDFKPRNVLVGDDGEVQVADFGLANQVQSPDDSGSGAGAPAEKLATSVVGTPAYMAPEQARGAVVDARADQYSFCVSLWEGLHGARPDGPDPEAPAAAGRSGEVPPWLWTALARGMAADPAARWPSMAALIEHIESQLAPARTGAGGRRRAYVVGGVVVAGLSVAGVLGLRGPAGRTADRHTAGDAPVTATAAAASADAPSPPPPPPVPVQLTQTGGCVYSPAFLDDDTVAFDLTMPGVSPDLYTYSLSTAALVQRSRGPVWEWRVGRGMTPGEVLYASSDMEHKENNSLVAIDLASGITRTLRAGSLTAITAARGAYYYFYDSGFELRRIAANVDEPVLPMPGYAAPQGIGVSPDGRWLAITFKSPAGVNELCEIDLEMPSFQCHPGQHIVPARSDLGTHRTIYYGSFDGVRAREANGTDRVAVAGEVPHGGVAVSPSGRTLVYSNCGARGVVQIVGGQTLTPDGRFSFPATGPGGWMAWVRNQRELIVRKPDGSIRELSEGEDQVLQPAFDAASSKLAFTRVGKKPGIWMADIVRAGPSQQLTFEAGDQLPLFLPDGSVLFTRMSGEDSLVFRVAPGGEPEQVIDRPRLTVAIDRATGRVLLRSADQQHLYWWDPVTRVESRGPATHPPGAEHTGRHAISPNGKWMLYQSGSLGHAIWRASLGRRGKPVMEQVFTAGEGSTMELSAIDDDGHAIVIEKKWRGELWRADAPATNPW